jgi:hypothetical protein
MAAKFSQLIRFGMWQLVHLLPPWISFCAKNTAWLAWQSSHLFFRPATV